MSEPTDLTADPLAEKLARLTPSATGFDRDALLIRAGQASARPSRYWQALAGLLLAGQLLTLALYFTKPTMLVQAPPVAVDLPDAGAAPPVVPAETPPQPSPYLRAIVRADIDDLPARRLDTDRAVPESIWTVRSTLRDAFVD